MKLLQPNTMVNLKNAMTLEGNDSTYTVKHLPATDVHPYDVLSFCTPRCGLVIYEYADCVAMELLTNCVVDDNGTIDGIRSNKNYFVRGIEKDYGTTNGDMYRKLTDKPMDYKELIENIIKIFPGLFNDMTALCEMGLPVIPSTNEDNKITAIGIRFTPATQTP